MVWHDVVRHEQMPRRNQIKDKYQIAVHLPQNGWYVAKVRNMIHGLKTPACRRKAMMAAWRTAAQEPEPGTGWSK